MTTVRAFSGSINHVPIHFTALTPFGQTEGEDEGGGKTRQVYCRSLFCLCFGRETPGTSPVCALNVDWMDGIMMPLFLAHQAKVCARKWAADESGGLHTVPR